MKHHTRRRDVANSVPALISQPNLAILVTTFSGRRTCGQLDSQRGMVVEDAEGTSSVEREGE